MNEIKYTLPLGALFTPGKYPAVAVLVLICSWPNVQGCSVDNFNRQSYTKAVR